MVYSIIVSLFSFFHSYQELETGAGFLPSNVSIYIRGYLYLRTQVDFAGMDLFIHDDVLYTFICCCKYSTKYYSHVHQIPRVRCSWWFLWAIVLSERPHKSGFGPVREKSHWDWGWLGSFTLHAWPIPRIVSRLVHPSCKWIKPTYPYLSHLTITRDFSPTYDSWEEHQVGNQKSVLKTSFHSERGRASVFKAWEPWTFLQARHTSWGTCLGFPVTSFAKVGERKYPPVNVQKTMEHHHY